MPELRQFEIFKPKRNIKHKIETHKFFFSHFSATEYLITEISVGPSNLNQKWHPAKDRAMKKKFKEREQKAFHPNIKIGNALLEL